MKKIILILLLLALFIFPSIVGAKDVYVSGYTKKNGTYVAPHHRTSPNNTTMDNYSTKGNYTPYVYQSGNSFYRGKCGYRQRSIFDD